MIFLLFIEYKHYKSVTLWDHYSEHVMNFKYYSILEIFYCIFCLKIQTSTVSWLFYSNTLQGVMSRTEFNHTSSRRLSSDDNDGHFVCLFRPTLSQIIGPRMCYEPEVMSIKLANIFQKWQAICLHVISLSLKFWKELRNCRKQKQYVNLNTGHRDATRRLPRSMSGRI